MGGGPNFFAVTRDLAHVAFPMLVLFIHVRPFTGYVKLSTKFGVILRIGNWFGAMAHSTEPNPALSPIARNQILLYRP